MTNSTYTSGHASTLLIPEGVVWLPYAGLVVTVVVWLGYDFYRFHQKNRVKYQRMEEHRLIVRNHPRRQRISMVSGIGLRFRRGKPVLGDVWNTSPSSSDISSCYSPLRRGGPISYSREVTPSDDAAGYSEGDMFDRCNSVASSVEFVGGDEEEEGGTVNKGWVIGGEYVSRDAVGEEPAKEFLQDEDGNNNEDDDTKPGDKSQDSLGFVVQGQKDRGGGEGGTLRAPISMSTSSSSNTIVSKSRASSPARQQQQQRHGGGTTTTTGAGGGVDDGGGGKKEEPQVSSPRQDASTQTHFTEVTLDMNSGESKDQVSPYPHHVTSPRILAVTPRRHHRHSIAVDSGHPNSPERPFVIDFSTPRSLQEGRTVESPTGSGTIKSLTARSEKRVPSLKLDLLTTPYSPTTEIVATKHGFVVEGIEVPHFPGGTSRPMPSSGSDIFKQPESHSHSQPFIKPLSPSPAITARVPSSRTSSPRRSSSSSHRSDGHHSSDVPVSYSYPATPQHNQSYSHPHHHRHKRRPDNLSVPGTPTSPTEDPSSPALLKKKSSSQSLARPRSFRAVSSSPRMIKEWDAEAASMKKSKESILEAPTTAPIPSHLYHQDEEGFFASSHSQSSPTKRTFHQEGGDNSKKGILFFSRLSGAGRHPVQSQGGGSHRRKNSGSGYKTGGFES